MKDMKDMKKGNSIPRGCGGRISAPRSPHQQLQFFMSFMLFMSFQFRLLGKPVRRRDPERRAEDYPSARNASVGWIASARRAGPTAATSPTNAMSAATPRRERPPRQLIA